MTANSNGSENRTAGRDFTENSILIGKFDGRHTINIAIPSEKKETKLLVKAQRAELNRLVDSAAKLGAGEAYEIWKKIHVELAVDSIDEITIDHYQTAVGFIHTIIADQKEKGRKKKLVGLILSKSKDEQTKHIIYEYCNRNFPTNTLNDLTREQLQQTLSWLEEHNIKHDDHSTSSIEQPAKINIAFKDFFLLYPKVIVAIFILGALFGFMVSGVLF